MGGSFHRDLHGILLGRENLGTAEPLAKNLTNTLRLERAGEPQNVTFAELRTKFVHRSFRDDFAVVHDDELVA